MILRASIWSFDGGAASVIIMEVTGPDFREDHPARHRINVKGYLKHSLNWVRGLYVRLFSWGFPEGARSVPCPPCMFWKFFYGSIYSFIIYTHTHTSYIYTYTHIIHTHHTYTHTHTHTHTHIYIYTYIYIYIHTHTHIVYLYIHSYLTNSAYLGRIFFLVLY